MTRAKASYLPEVVAEELRQARAAGAAEERARIVAMLRAEAKSLECSGMGLSSPALARDFCIMGRALRDMADRIERGER